MSILIKNATILSMVPGEKIFSGDIAIEGEKIKSIGKAVEGNYEQVIDGSKYLVMPGLVNTHGHAAMCLLRGYADDLDLMVWLNEKVFPAEARLTADDIKKGTYLAILEMIKSGTTAYADMYFFVDEIAQAVEVSGMRANICLGATDFEDGDLKIANSLEFAKNWHNQANGRIQVTMGPHAPYTCTSGFLEKIGNMARENKLGIQMHLAETLDEDKQIMERYACRPFEYVRRTGLFDDNKVIIAHGVWLNEEEILEAAKYNLSVAHNPRSNSKLASGIAPVEEYLQAGINLCIGTDSACSNNNLDMFQEMRMAAYLAKIRKLNPTVLPAKEALNAATVNGARALGFSDSGMLAVGKQADLIMINLDAPHLTPLHDLESHLVYAANGSDVENVIINGKLIMYKKEMLTLDEEKIIADANQVKKRLFS